MRTLLFSSPTFASELIAFCQGASASQDIVRSVGSILDDIRLNGDEAVVRYASKFDGATFKADVFRLPASEIKAALTRISAVEKSALTRAHRSIRDYNLKGKGKGWSGLNLDGARVGEKLDPIRRVGLYIPGGQVPLVSTVLMTATLAKIAGCPEIAAFTPCGASGKVCDALLAALAISGVSEVYRIGGVQAIAAMAYGTASIAPVDKIFGPGNAYVCEAKRQVFGSVGVDSLPGPSELMIVADASVRADFAAADLLAQAEHGSGREKIYLLTTSAAEREAISREISRQLPLLGRSEKVERVLEEGFLAIQVSSLSQAAQVANEVAPEHLQLMLRAPGIRQLLKSVTTAGAIFTGNYSPTALGDFTAGPSHVLPTGRAGRFFSGLRVADFQRRTSLVQYDRKSVAKAQPTVAAFAAMEKLDAHGRSVALRVEKP